MQFVEMFIVSRFAYSVKLGVIKRIQPSNITLGNKTFKNFFQKKKFVLFDIPGFCYFSLNEERCTDVAKVFNQNSDF